MPIPGKFALALFSLGGAFSLKQPNVDRLPKNADLTDYSQSDLNKVALRLNQRPRQTLGFQTPASKLQESVASTH